MPLSRGHKQQPFFEIGLSIEKTEVAHRTLMLRAAFERLRGTKDVRHYYSYIRGEIDEAAFHRIPAVASAFEHAAREARCLELGKSDETDIDAEIRSALNGRRRLGYSAERHYVAPQQGQSCFAW